MHDKLFSNGMALTAISISDEYDKLIDTKYIDILKLSKSQNNNVNFIIDILSQYVLQQNKLKSIKQENYEDTKK